MQKSKLGRLQQWIHIAERMRRLRKSLKPQNYWKSVAYLTLIVFISRLYVDKLKWCINSEWAALGRAFLNVLLESRVNIHRLRSSWRKTFWAGAVIKMMQCNTYDFLRDNNFYSCLLLYVYIISGLTHAPPSQYEFIVVNGQTKTSKFHKVVQRQY